MKSKQSPGGDQFYVPDAQILRDLAPVSKRWHLYVKQPDGTYIDSKLILVTKEQGKVGHDRVQTEGQHIPNLIAFAIKLYGIRGRGVPTGVLRLDFDIDDADPTKQAIYLTPTAYELGTNVVRLRKPTRQRAAAKRKISRQIGLFNLPPGAQNRQTSRSGYTVSAEKLENKHNNVLERLRMQLSDKGLPAKGSIWDADCYTYYQHRDYLFEIKTGLNIEAKARDAIGQLLQYKFFYLHQFPDPLLCIVLNKKPRDSLVAFLEYVGVLICWTTRNGFDCPAYCSDALGFLF